MRRKAKPKVREFLRVYAAFLDILVLRPDHYARLIRDTADSYSRMFRAAAGPDVLARAAQEQYVRGTIDADEFEQRLARIADEFGVV